MSAWKFVLKNFPNQFKIKHVYILVFTLACFWLILILMNCFSSLQEHNIADPTEIIFEMSKDERKNFYRTVAKGLMRPLFSVYRRVTRMYDQKNYMGKYTVEEVDLLKEWVHQECDQEVWKSSTCMYMILNM